MKDNATILNLEAGAVSLRGSFNPRDKDIRVNKHGQFVRSLDGQPGPVVNSMLMEDEWIEIDRVVLAGGQRPACPWSDGAPGRCREPRSALVHVQRRDPCHDLDDGARPG